MTKFFAMVLLFASPMPALAADATLTVRFQEIQAAKGQVMLSLFDSEAAHDAGGRPVRVAAIKVEGDHAIATFEGLAPGKYAVKSFHDVNGDGKMNVNPFGMPVEPFAFSNNAKAMAGPAKWAATNFEVAAGATEIRINIK